MWERLRDRAQAFEGAFVWMPQRVNLAKGGEMQLVDAVITTSDFFSTLGVRTNAQLAPPGCLESAIYTIHNANDATEADDAVAHCT